MIMTIKEAIEILEEHQKYRRDKNVPPKHEMQDPVKVGKAIDTVVRELNVIITS